MALTSWLVVRSISLTRSACSSLKSVARLSSRALASAENAGDFADLRVGGQALQPAHFDQGAETDQAEFAENGAQGLGFAGITAVYRETAVSEESCMGCSRTVRLLEGRISYMKNAPGSGG